jgi:hypothetical protein
VQHQSNAYYTYDKNSFFRDEARPRADGQESAGSGYTISTDTYNCVVEAIHKDIGYQARQNADAGINLDVDATQFVTQRLLLRREIQWAADFFVNAIWGTSTTPTLWSTYSTSDPIGDIETGKVTILTNTGYMPNTLVLGYQVYQALKNHPDVIDRVKYTNFNASVTPTNQLLAALFGVDNVYVAMATKATNVEGETAAMSLVQGKNALLCYVNPTPSLLAPSAGYVFSWRGVTGGIAGAEIGITRFPMPHLKSDRVEGEIAYDNKLVASDLGYFFNTVVA